MAGFVIKKSKPLNGEVWISGAKNAALPALAAEGITEIVDNGNIDRGYVGIDMKLKGLVAEIERSLSLTEDS